MRDERRERQSRLSLGIEASVCSHMVICCATATIHSCEFAKVEVREDTLEGGGGTYRCN